MLIIGSRIIHVFLEVLHFLSLLVAESAHTLEHLVPVNECSVKLGTVDADKLGLAADGETASAAHTGTVHHNGVERYLHGDVVLLSHEAAELHHDGRTDGEHLVHVAFLSDEALDACRYDTLIAVAAIVGHDDDLVAALTDFVLEDDEVA